MVTPKSTLALREAAVVVAICFGLFILSSIEASAAGFPEAKFTDDSTGWTIAIELALGAAALLYLRARRFDLAALYPRPTWRGAVFGVLLGVACWIVGTLVTSAMPGSAQPQSVAFSFEAVSLVSAVAVSLVNGVYEEVFLLGVLVRGLRGFGLSVAIGLPLLVRMLYHTYQGPLGVVWVGTSGLILTLGYVSRGDLWPPVFAHVLWDIVAML